MFSNITLKDKQGMQNIIPFTLAVSGVIVVAEVLVPAQSKQAALPDVHNEKDDQKHATHGMDEDII